MLKFVPPIKGGELKGNKASPLFFFFDEVKAK